MSFYNNQKDKDKKKGNSNQFGKPGLTTNQKGTHNTKGVKNTRTVGRSQKGS